jgi:hypothetical protein
MADLTQPEIDACAPEFAAAAAYQYPAQAAEIVLLVDPSRVSGDSADILAQAVESASSRWASFEPAAAADWAARLAEGRQRTIAARNVARRWRLYDPAATLAWAQSLPDQASRDAALGELGEWARSGGKPPPP